MRRSGGLPPITTRVRRSIAWPGKEQIELVARTAEDHRILTPRELEVIGWLALGLTDNAIAYALGISGHTVRTHVKKLKIKIGVHSRAELAAWYGRHEGTFPFLPPHTTE